MNGRKAFPWCDFRRGDVEVQCAYRVAVGGRVAETLAFSGDPFPVELLHRFVEFLGFLGVLGFLGFLGAFGGAACFVRWARVVGLCDGMHAVRDEVVDESLKRPA